jgi:hypothetical protein
MNQAPFMNSPSKSLLLAIQQVKHLLVCLPSSCSRLLCSLLLTLPTLNGDCMLFSVDEGSQVIVGEDETCQCGRNIVSGEVPEEIGRWSFSLLSLLLGFRATYKFPAMSPTAAPRSCLSCSRDYVPLDISPSPGQSHDLITSFAGQKSASLDIPKS